MIYIDSNILINSAANDAEPGKKSRRLLMHIIKGNQEAATSVLTIDEALWALQREKGKPFAANVARNLLDIRNLAFLDTTQQIIEEALHAYTHDNLNPRDAIHLATMRVNGITTIASYDDDFDQIKNITRITP